MQIKKADMNPRCEKKVTFLRQHDLDQVPGVETKNSFLSADVLRLPQSTNANCISKKRISRLQMFCQLSECIYQCVFHKTE